MVKQCFTGFHESALNQCAKGDAWFSAFADRGFKCFHAEWLGRFNAGQCSFCVVFITFNTDEVATQLLGHSTCCAGAEKWIKHHIAYIAGGQHHALEQCFRLLRGVQLIAVLVFKALTTGAEWQRPIGTHLQIIIKYFHRFIMEAIFGFFFAAGPD